MSKSLKDINNELGSVATTNITLFQSQTDLSDLLECLPETPVSDICPSFSPLTGCSNILEDVECFLDEEEEILMTELVTSISQMDEEQELFEKHNYKYAEKICNTLQGELFRAEIMHKKSTQDQKYVVIKKTDKELWEKKICIKDGMSYCVDEDIVKEAVILKHLTVDNASMGHHIVKYIDFFESDTHFYLVYEYIDDQMNLKDFISEAHKYIAVGKLNIKDYLKIIRYLFWQIFATIHWLHVDMKCCHLNMCLENVLLTDCNFVHYENGLVSVNPKISAKLTGFGVSELFKESFNCNKRGSLFIDIQYQSPNIIEDVMYDARSADIWSLGMMLYHCMIGKPLYNKIDAEPIKGTGFWAVMNGNIMRFIYINKLQKFVYGKSLSLLCGLINPDSSKRLNSMEILQHEWFKRYYKRYKQKIAKQTFLQKQKEQYDENEVAFIKYDNNI